MINNIKLKNYKSYQNTDINVKPICLFCGKNSSGKTSIIQSILLLKQSFASSGNNYLLINGSYTNNGLYSNICRMYPRNSKMALSLSCTVDSDNPSFRDLCKSIGMGSKVKNYRSFDICADFEFKENSAIPQVGEIKKSTIILTTNYNENARNYSGESIKTQISMTSCEDDQRYSIELKQFPTPLFANTKVDFPYEYQDHFWGNCICYFRGMQLVSLYKEFLSKKATSTFDLLARESNLVFFDELDKCPEMFYSAFYTLFDNTVFKDYTYDVDTSGLLIVLTSNYTSIDEMKKLLGLPIFFRIDKFIHFDDFSAENIYYITKKEIHDRINEYASFFSEEELYAVVSPKIKSRGENARTIKNTIQYAIEELMFYSSGCDT